MPYPSELTPRPTYRYIREIDSIIDRHLLRWSALPPEEFYDKVNGIPVSVGVVEKIGKNVMDLSTSLLGSFHPKHYNYRVNPPTIERRQYLVFDLWPEGEEVMVPVKDEDWEATQVGTYYHLLVATVHNFEIPFRSGTEEFSARLVVMHTPCRSNYWHFSVRVYDDQDIDVASRYANNPRKGPSNRDDKILKAALKGIRQLIQLGVPAFQPIPEALYHAA